MPFIKCKCGCSKTSNPRKNYFEQGLNSKVLKAKKPAWQDTIPRDDPELKRAYSIAAKYVPPFTRAFNAANKALIDDQTATNIRRIWSKEGSVNQIMGAIPFFKKTAATEGNAGQRYVDKLVPVYEGTYEEAGKEGMKRVNEGFGTKLRFKMPVPVQKVKGDVPLVAINVHSVKWIEQRALELLTQVITPAQKKVLRRVIKDAFSRGIRAETLINELRANVGLTLRDYKATVNRRNLLRQGGMKEADVEIKVGRYREKLIRSRAQTIARTETIAAQAQGRNAAWNQAKDSGDVPPNVERVWVSAPESPNPNRPCEICLDLDGKTATLTGNYSSAFEGAVFAPPAHPNCRCTEIMRRKE
jgi:hypothetical protein